MCTLVLVYINTDSVLYVTGKESERIHKTEPVRHRIQRHHAEPQVISEVCPLAQQETQLHNALPGHPTLQEAVNGHHGNEWRCFP